MTAARLMVIRHAPALHGGRMAGRRDVAADLSDAMALGWARAALAHAGVERAVSSPARRCVATAAALGWTPPTDARLWEQDFGAWEGVAFAELPDLGPLEAVALAAHRPPGGESFAELCHRVAPALNDIAAQGGCVAVFAHAGVVRAALALALGAVPPALAFEVAPLSLTELRALPGGGWSIARVNHHHAGGGA